MTAKTPVIALAACILMLAGCTTQRQGRMLPLSDEAQKIMQCPDIDAEIAHVQKFKDDVNKTAPDPEALMMDFGIGNAVERKEALDSADRRLEQLDALKKTKNCGAPR